PVIEAQPGRDAARDQPVDQPVVKVEPARLDRAAAGRQNARPRGREAISIEAAARQPFHVLDPAMIVIAGDIAGVAVLHYAGRMRVHIPDALATPVLVDRAFDLIA